MAKYLVKGPYRWDGSGSGGGRDTLGYVQAASEAAARVRWEKLHPDDDATEMAFEESVPRIDCLCPQCGWQFKGTGTVADRSLEREKDKRCTLCEADRDVAWKRKKLREAEERLRRLRGAREQEKVRRAERERKARAAEARRRPTIEELRGRDDT